MVKVSPIVRSFNAGLFSDLMAGRSDLDQYAASLRESTNCILTPQGPIICRSGTKFVVPARTNDETSQLVNFTFSDETAQALEFASDRIRFIDETGIQVYAPLAAVVSSVGPMVVTVIGLFGSPGDQIALNGFAANYNLNGVIANIVGVVGNDYTLDVVYPALPLVGCTVSLVYAVPLTYSEDQRKLLRVIQDVDVMYLLVEDVPVQKLSRYDAYDWRLEQAEFIDGPYLPVNLTSTALTPSATGNAVPDMTTNILPAGSVATGSTARGAVAPAATFLGRVLQLGLAATDYFHAFDSSDLTYWAPTTAQSGIIEYDVAAGLIVDGYMVLPGLDNQDVTYLPSDYAPRDWTFDGWDGANWIVLDKVHGYVSYDNDRSVFFDLANPASYTKYRLNITACVTTGPIEPRVRRLILRSPASSVITFTASSLVGINNDTGFQPTDVNRLIRVQGGDTFWRYCRITAVTDPLHVTVLLLSDPLNSLDPIREWRLGLWSDTTGYPSSGDLWKDRLWLGGTRAYPNALVGSSLEAYEDMTPSESDGVVLDTNAFVGFLKARKLSRIKWISSDDRGLIVGTGSQEYLVASSVSSDSSITPATVQARSGTHRGSAAVEPVRVDDKLLYVQRNARALRSLEYSYAANGYTGGYISPNKSQFASHLGVAKFVEIDFASEPHNILWLRDGNNKMVGFTYNPSQGVEGWHQHDFAGALIESMVVIPQLDQRQDTLWMQTKRTVNGQDVRYIEFLVQPWDFDDTLEDAHFVDCGLRYTDVPTDLVYGFQHLEGLDVYGLADNKPFGPIQIVNGALQLDFEASNIVAGLGFDSTGMISPLEAGSQNGTAQGKPKRINNTKLRLWATACGKIGVWDDELNALKYEDIEFPDGDQSTVEDVHLFTGDTLEIQLPEGYGRKGVLAFKRPKETPLPLNIVAMFPSLEAQDGG